MRCRGLQFAFLGALGALLACGARVERAPLDGGRADSGPGLSSPTQSESKLGAIKIEADPKRALVFVDGRFAGDLSGESIELTREPGTVELRLSEAGFLDAIARIDIEAGVAKTLAFRLPRRNEDWVAPNEPIVLRVGSTVRGALAANVRGGTRVRYAVHEDFIPERLIAVLDGAPKFSVKGPDGSEVPVVDLEGFIDGCPGGQFKEYRGAASGIFELEVSGNPGPFAFLLTQALPPRAVSENPAFKKRRVPGKPPRKS